MTRITAMLFLTALAALLLPVGNALLAADLIEPTRTLQGAGAPEGKLAVSSEPPGLPVSLDGMSLGKTPTSLNEVKAGVHQLRVEASETKIIIEPGKTMQISLYKGSFIKMPEPEKGPAKPPTTAATPPPESKPSPPRVQEKPPPPIDPMEHKRLFGYY